MKRLFLTSVARPSLLAAMLLPTLLIAGSSRETQASVGALFRHPAPSAVGLGALSLDDATLAELAAAGADDALSAPPLGAQRYLHEIPFGATIEEVGHRHGVDPLLIAAVAEAESNFRVDAVSPKGALGLMQVMPMHVDDGVEPFDPEVNLELGAALLAELTSRFDGRLELALAAYHAGPGAVQRFGGVPPYRSTERYVERVLEIYLEHYSQIVSES
jgi:soluble lytic murein transglycosylase-like protein